MGLSHIQFDAQQFQIYYLNYEQKLKETEQQLKELIEANEQRELEAYRAGIREQAARQVTGIITKLKFYKDREWNFYKFEEELNKLSHIGLEVLNARLQFADKRPQGKTLINHYITTATEPQLSFIDYLLRDQRIVYNANITDDDGSTTLQQILKNEQLRYRHPLIKSLFKRGYQLTEADIHAHQGLPMDEKEKAIELQTIKWCDQLKDRTLVDDVFQHYNFLFVIETARRNVMIGFNYKDWISFGVQAILKHKQFYVYIERAFKKYGLWAIIEAHDKHKSFQKQVAKLQVTPPEQNVGLVYPLMYEFYHDIA